MEEINISNLLNVEEVNKRLKATSTNNYCEEEQGTEVDDQDTLVDVATSTSKHCSSSPTSTSGRFIESAKNQSIKSDKESTSSRTSQFSDEQNRVDSFFCQCADEPPEVNDRLKGYWTALIPHIQTQQDMDSYYAYTKKHIPGEDKTVYPGNLANRKNLKGWLKERRQEQTAAVNPIAQAQEEMAAETPVDHSNEPLPGDMQKWMEGTCSEFGEACNQQEYVSRLEWYYQRYRGSEVDFYNALLDAYRETFRKQGDMTMFFAGVERRVFLSTA